MDQIRLQSKSRLRNTSLAKVFGVYLFILTCLVVNQPIFTQELPPLPQTRETERNREEEKYINLKDRARGRLSKESYIEQFQQGRSQTIVFNQPILSHSIDPASYILGPGDGLQLMLWGDLQQVYPLPVLPEGTISIPTIGVVEVDGETLASAREKVENAIGRSYRDVDFTLDLVQLRKFRVYVTGEVKEPATYFAQSQDRISDIIELAGGATDWADIRRVEIHNGSDEVSIIDLQDFYRNGNFENNPSLRSGDLIHVPAIDPSKYYVIVESDQESNGIYPIQHDESLLTFLQHNQILSRKADLRYVEVYRQGQPLVHDYLSGQNGATDIKLQSGDRIKIPRVRDFVYVEGAVSQPGPQRYFPNMRAKDYAGLAGLTNEAGGLNRIKVKRSSDNSVEKGGDVVVERGDIVMVPQSRKESFKEIFQIVGSVASVIVSFAIIRDISRN